VPYKHGHRRANNTSKTWLSWRAMVARCYNSGASDYSRYGGRGITVCFRWRISFSAFLGDMGERPSGTTLDRINNFADYVPSNCRWATRNEQAANRRTNIMLTHKGKTMCIAEWARELGLERSTIRWRLKKGWSVEKALTAPIMSRAERGILGLQARGII